ncbi:MAG: hypothetical protein ABF335_11945 [Alphaproteobacteria bacterium]
MNKISMLIGLLLLLFIGLALGRVVSFPDYYYLSFENGEDIEVLERRIPIENGYSMVPIPYQFQLKRPNYTLSMKLGSHRYLPTVLIDAVGVDGRRLVVEGKDNSRCTDFTLLTYNKLLEFKWSWPRSSRHIECNAQKTSDLRGTMELTLRDENGAVYEESLQFSLKRNGNFVSIDTL